MSDYRNTVRGTIAAISKSGKTPTGSPSLPQTASREYWRLLFWLAFLSEPLLWNQATRLFHRTVGPCQTDVDLSSKTRKTRFMSKVILPVGKFTALSPPQEKSKENPLKLFLAFGDFKFLFTLNIRFHSVTNTLYFLFLSRKRKEVQPLVHNGIYCPRYDCALNFS